MVTNQAAETGMVANQAAGIEMTANKAAAKKFVGEEMAKKGTAGNKTAQHRTGGNRAGKKKRLSRAFFARDGITVARELLGKILVHETAVGTVRGVITEVESYMGEEDKGSHTYGGRRTERTEPMYHAGGTSYVYLIYGMYSCMNVAAMTEGIAQAVLLRSVVPADRESEERMQRLRMMDAAARQAKRAGQEAVTAEAVEPGREAAEAWQEAAQTGRKVMTAGRKAVTAGQEAAETKAAEVWREAAEPERKPCPASIRKHLADGPGKLCIAMGITRADNDVDMVKSGSLYVTEGWEVDPSEIQAGKRIGIDYAEEAADFLWRFYLKNHCESAQ